ncbi:hypothetical protein V501_07963 [Pseudogymnoascus sp. VKM F-4519 (FW-2642)]|nr:hypothetical protein V501_07963 [Pseudogymnoascus sp. VKM F-4519 (FW-2642)]
MHTIRALEMHAVAHIQQTVMVATATPTDVTPTVTVKLLVYNTAFMDKGGLAAMSAALAKPMVLVMSLWDDHAASMLWLDSTYPMDSAKLGATRGSCATSSGVPADVEAEQPGDSVIYSNVKFGPTGSTFDSTGVEDQGSAPTTTGGGTPTATSIPSTEAYGFAYGTTDGMEDRQHRELQSTSALLEGNMFGNVDSPMASYTGLIYSVPDSSSASACSSTLGRACEANTVTGSGGWPSLTNTAALATINRYTSKMYVVTPLPASSVKSKFTGNAGVGDI